MDCIIQGDCLEALKDLPDAAADCFIIDPPYNIGYNYNEYKDNLKWEQYLAWQIEILKEAERVLKSTGSVFWLNYPEAAAQILGQVTTDTSLKLFEWITWIYHQHTGGTPLRKATRVWLWLCKDEPYVDDKQLRAEYRNMNDKRIAARVRAGHKPVDYDWWFYEQVKNVSMEKEAHPCQLPLKMVMRLVEMATPPEGLMIDPFSGSGTSCVAALKLHRHWIGIEKDAKYAVQSIARLYNAVPDLLA